MGIRFRMFPPEADYRDGTITVRSTHPDGEVRYTNDSSEPTLASALYEGPIRTKNPERYLFRTFYGEGHSPAVPTTADTTVALGAGSERTVRIPLERYVDRNGLWLLSVSQQQDNAKIDRMEVNGPDTAYTIIRNGQKTNPFNDLRLYIDERNRTADLILALSNRSQRSDTLTLGLRPSPYIEPPVRVTSSLVPSKRFPLRNASDYHFGTYTRVASPCKAGDYILFTFEEPVDCESVDLRTGIPNVTRYIVTKGRGRVVERRTLLHRGRTAERKRTDRMETAQARPRYPGVDRGQQRRDGRMLAGSSHYSHALRERFPKGGSFAPSAYP